MKNKTFKQWHYASLGRKFEPSLSGYNVGHLADAWQYQQKVIEKLEEIVKVDNKLIPKQGKTIAKLREALTEVIKESNNSKGLEACYILENIEKIVQTAIMECFGDEDE